MEDNFGYWFAGFSDGEGCFTTITGGRPVFKIMTRADDETVLVKIQERLGFGRMFHVPRRVKGGYLSNPLVDFQVVKRDDLLELVKIFEKYPLQSKKADDFEIWKELVAEFAKEHRLRRLPRIRALAKALSAVKKFNEEYELPDEEEDEQMELW